MVPFPTLVRSLTTLFLLLHSSTQVSSQQEEQTEITEPRTGITFPIHLPSIKQNKNNARIINHIGVRSRGPIKVYAVAQYGTDAFFIQMNMNVNGAKLSGALMDALIPRCNDMPNNIGDCSQDGSISEFERLVLDGLAKNDGSATRGTKLIFDSKGGNKLVVRIDDVVVGSVYSKGLAKAFGGIYTDENAVCVMKSVDLSKERSMMVGGEDDWAFGTVMLICVCVALLTTAVLDSVWDNSGKKKD